MDPPTVVVCSGKDCRRAHPDDWADLVQRLDRAGARVVESGCLSICSGPVAVVDAPGAVYGKLRSRKARRDLARAVGGRPRSTRLAKRAVIKDTKAAKARKGALRAIRKAD